MKNKTFLLLLILLVSSVSRAQAPKNPLFIVKGLLLDSITKEAEPYATLKIAKKNSPQKAVKMAVTDLNGKFSEKLSEPSTYILTISSVGKATVQKEFTFTEESKTIDLGTLFVSDATNELKGIEVVAQKPLVKVDIDKIEYNIQDDPDSKTNTVIEMLRKVPLVTVDGEDNIQVNGSSNFKIHVNGKPNTMMSSNPKEVLKSMPANSIKYIEVITNPGAKYDAEGVGGILNIVTIDNRGVEGYTVTLSGSARNTGVGGSVYGTVKKNKLTVTGNYNYSLNNSPKNYNSVLREDYTGKTRLTTDNANDYDGSFQYSNLEASYEIDTLRLLSMSFGLYGGGNDSKGDGFTQMTMDTGLPVYKYATRNKTDGSWYSIRGNIDYQRMFSVKDRMLTFSYKINTQPENSDSYAYYSDMEIPDEWKQRLALENRRSDGETNTTEHTFQTDYTTPLGKMHTLETGAKYIIRNNVSENNVSLAQGGTDDYAYNEKKSSHYEHLNNILAIYGGYSFKYKTLSAKAGLRYEYTSQEVNYLIGTGSDFNSYLSDWVPSASMGLKIGQTQNLSLGYNMRIWRPSIYFLNPYVDDSNPSAISYGNSELKSEKSHAFNLSYSNFTAKLSVNLSLRHSFNNNSIENYSFIKDGILNSTYANIGKSRTTGMSAYINWNASPKTRIYVNASGNYSDYRSPSQNLKNNGWYGFAYGGAQHTFPLDIRLSLNLMGSTPYISIQGRGSSYYDYGLSLNRSFIDKRLTLSAFAYNFLKKYTDYSNSISSASFSQNTNSSYSRMRYGFSVSYRIGELKASVKKAARTINNDDVKGGGSSEGGGGEN